jgi:DNA recombination protein RmuC
MEIAIIILLAIVLVGLAVLAGFFIWDRLRAGDRWKKQSETLAEEVGQQVGQQIADTTKVFGEVSKSLGELKQQTQQMQEVGKNISSLQDLLRAPKFRGGFGELLLERLLADIGLPRDNYSLQYEFRNGETVDAVIRIGGKLVPIDSKFPLEDFQRILAAKEEEQAALRKQFIRRIKNHIDNVTKYILPDENTFDFALMYIPAENVYYETILRGTEESEIYSYSLQKRAIPVSPNSLYAYLQVIILGLKGLHIEAAANEIQGRLGRLQGDLANFQEDYATLGTHIRHAAQKYDEADRKLTKFGDKLQLAGEAPIERLPEGSTKTDEES